MTNKLVELVNVSKHKLNQEALLGVSFDIVKQEIIGVVGAVESGKTLLLKLLSQQLNCDQGEIRFQYPYQSGFMIESSCYSYLSAFQNLKITAKIKGVPISQIDEIMRRIKVDSSSKPMKRLSLGGRKRVELAQALLGYPSLVLLDHPFDGLDVVSVFELKQYLLELKDVHHMSFVITSNILDGLELLADRIIFLKEGRIKQMIQSKELLEIQKHHSVLQTQDMNKTVALLEMKIGLDKLKVLENGYILIEGEIKQDEMLAYLIDHQIKILSFYQQRFNLEDYYYKVTDDETDFK